MQGGRQLPTITDDVVGGVAGGIANENGIVRVERSTVSGTRATGGGGLFTSGGTGSGVPASVLQSIWQEVYLFNGHRVFDSPNHDSVAGVLPAASSIDARTGRLATGGSLSAAALISPVGMSRPTSEVERRCCRRTPGNRRGRTGWKSCHRSGKAAASAAV